MGFTGLQKEKACPRCGFLNPFGSIYCSRCAAVLSELEAFKLEEQRRREEEIIAKVIQKLIELAPDVLERVLKESGALEEMRLLESEGYQTGAGGGI